MKIKFDNLKSKRYFLLFVFVMALNISLAVILLRVSFSQTQKEDSSSQRPVKVEVMEQKDNPLRITVVNVDNSSLSFQDIIYSLQNVSNKPIKAYTLLGDGKRGGKVITSFFTAKRFQTGESIIGSLDIERVNITDGEAVLLSIDYVEFEDGSSWGSDSAEKSEEIAGQREGIKAAIKRLKDTITKQTPESTNNIVDFLKQDMREIVVDVPDANQSDKWQGGFRFGYKSVISILQRIENQKTEKIIEKLDEIEKIANQGGKQ